MVKVVYTTVDTRKHNADTMIHVYNNLLDQKMTYDINAFSFDDKGYNVMIVHLTKKFRKEKPVKLFL